MSDSKIIGGLAADLCPGPYDVLMDERARFLASNSYAIKQTELVDAAVAVAFTADVQRLLDAAVAYAKSAPEPRVENHDHDSLFTRFEQIERLLASACTTAQCARRPDIANPLWDALEVVRLIRAQVLK